jgi:predicted nucleotidyltransferase
METSFPMSDPVTSAFAEIQAALHRLQIPFCVVGSFASSARGVPRATMDVDLLVRMGREQADQLVGQSPARQS